MRVYRDDSDEFDPEYLTYLDTLSYEASRDARIRKTFNKDGELVRFEVWDHRNAYYNFPLSGWLAGRRSDEA